MLLAAGGGAAGCAERCDDDCFVDAVVRLRGAEPPVAHRRCSVDVADCGGCRTHVALAAVGDSAELVRTLHRVLSAPRAKFVARVREPAHNALVRVLEGLPAVLVVSRPAGDAFRAPRDGCWCVLLDGVGAGCMCDATEGMSVAVAAERGVRERVVRVQVGLRNHVSSHVFDVSAAHRVRVTWEAHPPVVGATAHTAALGTAAPAAPLCRAGSRSRCRVNLGCLHVPHGDDWISPLHAGCEAVASVGGGPRREALFAWNASMAAGEVADWEDVDPAVVAISATGLTGHAAPVSGARAPLSTLSATLSRLETASVDAFLVTSLLSTVPGVAQRHVLSEMRRCGRVMFSLRAPRAVRYARSAMKPTGHLSLIEFNCHESLETLLALERAGADFGFVAPGQTLEDAEAAGFVGCVADDAAIERDAVLRAAVAATQRLADGWNTCVAPSIMEALS